MNSNKARTQEQVCGEENGEREENNNTRTDTITVFSIFYTPPSPTWFQHLNGMTFGGVHGQTFRQTSWARTFGGLRPEANCKYNCSNFKQYRGINRVRIQQQHKHARTLNINIRKASVEFSV